MLSNLYGFRSGLGTLECFDLLIGPIYDMFCLKEFLSAAFVEVKSVFNSVHIPTLINH